MASQRERNEWARQWKIVKAVQALIKQEDDGEPPALDEKDRKSLQVVLRIASESDTVFRRILRRRGPVRWDDQVDHLCDSIEAGMEFFAAVKQSARTIRGVNLPPRKSKALRDLLVDHKDLFRRVQARGLGLPRRLSALLELIRIELIFFGHVW
jgi:hypothetical protein